MRLFFQAEDGIRDVERSRGLGDVYKRQILALVGFKMHSQARAFLQPTRANIHQYQFNNPIV